MNIILINQTDSEHLNDVKVEMKKMGAPSIKAVWMECWNSWVALEGSHRIVAAVEMGIDVTIEAVEYSSALVADVTGDEDIDPWMTIEELVDSAADRSEMMVTL